VNDPPPRPTVFRQDMEGALEAILLTALAKEPPDRYQNTEQFRQALAGVVSVPLERSNRLQQLKATTPEQGEADDDVKMKVRTVWLRVQRAGDVNVVSLAHREILDEQLIDLLHQEAKTLVNQLGCRQILVDFGNVRYFSSTGLGPVISLQKKLLDVAGEIIFIKSP